MNVSRIALVCACSVIAGCASNPGLESETVTNARPMAAGTAGGVAFGDCTEARKRAAAKPDLDVDRLPGLVRQSPAPFQRMPAAVKTQVNAKGAVVKVDVVVDTLGRADMKTFKVVESSTPWLADNVKTVMPRWTFTPAELAGCKVRRVYKFSATSKPRKS
jgi:hypothetical protein